MEKYTISQVLNPGHASTPIICGYNSGQHMFVPASDKCNQIHINIDTGTTTTTRLTKHSLEHFFKLSM